MAQWDYKTQNRLLFILKRIIDLFINFLFKLVFYGKNEELPPISNLILLESAVSLAAKIREKKLSSEALVQAYIARIKQVNPVVNAVVETRFDEALKEARKVDLMLASDSRTQEEIAKAQPLLGIPFTTKNSVGIKGLPYPAGLVARKNILATKDADLVIALRQAGAIPIALTNTSELCMWWESHNKLYGVTCNPYNTSCIAGGSSGGEGSIISAGGSIIGIGSDIGGSIRIPAYCNGIFGHKTTEGISPLDGKFPDAHGKHRLQVVTGPMCRYATDLMPTLRALIGTKVSLLKEPVPMPQLKILYMDETPPCWYLTPLHPENKAAIHKAIDHFSHCYGIKAKRLQLPQLAESYPIWIHEVLTGSEAKPFVEEVTCGRGQLRPGWELLRWCLMMSEYTLVTIVQAFTELKYMTQPPDPRYGLMCQDLRTEMTNLLGRDTILIFPSLPDPALYHHQPLYRPYDYVTMGIWNMVGLPSTQVPMGLSSTGLPLGIQVIANHHCDPLTIAVAEELERAFGGWVPPCPVL